MITRESALPGVMVFEDRATGRRYRRLVGAIGWPWAEQPGFLVVVAEALVIEKGLQARPLELRAAAPASRIPEVFRQAKVLGRLHQVEGWLTELDNQEAVNWFMNLDQADWQPGQKRRQPIFLHPAGFSTASLGLAVQLIDEQSQRTRKVLTLGEEYGPAFDGERRGFLPEDLRKPVGNFPRFAALGYAVAELVFNGEPEEWQRPLKHQTLKDYQPGR